MSRRLTLLLAAMAGALVLASGTAIAQLGTEGREAFAASPLGEEADQRLSATAAAQPEWQMSRESNTGYRHVFTRLWTPLTGERVGYWGASDASYPKVGDLYYGGAEVYNYGNPTGDGTTTANFEVKLPPATKFVVNPDVQSRKIRCFWFHPATNTDGEFTGGRFQGNGCPAKPTAGGIHGTRFLPTTNDGTWRIPAGYGISVTFPLVSSSPLKGYTNTPNPACIVGSVWAAGGGTPDGRTWDAPTAGEVCPLPQYHGTDRDVVVSAAQDTTKPRAKRVVPAENATGIASGANVSAFFSEAMRAGSINTKTIKLFKAGTATPIASAVSYDAATKKAALNPNANLKRGAKYKAVVTTGVRDLAGNPLDQSPSVAGNQPKQWFFTVKP